MICLYIIELSWQEATRRTLNLALNKLWPDAVAPIELIGFESKHEVEIETLGESDGSGGRRWRICGGTLKRKLLKATGDAI